MQADALWLEFGVWTGKGLRVMGTYSKHFGKPANTVFGFDSFKGLPEGWRKSLISEKETKGYLQAGSFNLGGSVPEALRQNSNVAFEVGWFNETLPGFLARHSQSISFVHIDSDLYSSAISVLPELSPRLIPGAIVVFDELINYVGYREGEMRALHEWLQSAGFRKAGLTGVEIIGYPGPRVLLTDEDLEAGIKKQGHEHGKFPQCAVTRVW
eukprot:TRINITY_DN30110_c0_g1_i1.p1 TRINITY_DN30110_c0_g1~~TRINITY_DN30110_c0_g1_i1.p1  ORF type:complete len:212 (+),score=21.60 TRINITY_DN30110_c0_g1_i1:327-962(+)